MSHSIGRALKHYLPRTDKNMAINTGDFILLINKWFDEPLIENANMNIQ